MAEFHVLDLAGGIASRREEGETGQSVHGLPRGDENLEKAGIQITSLGDAGVMLDEQAKLAYRRALRAARRTGGSQGAGNYQAGAGQNRRERVRCPLGCHIMGHSGRDGWSMATG
jgi:hypothetical protein